MDDKTLQKKMDEFIKLGNALDAEAKRRYGRGGSLFHEADGSLYIMDGDSYDSIAERQQHIKLRSNKIVRWGAGAW